MIKIPDDSGQDLAFPPLAFPEEPCDPTKRPLSEQEEQEYALEVIRTHHARIATTLESTWGSQECADYLRKLVFDGSDPVDLNRVGFKPAVLDAIMVLLRLHKVVAS